MKQGFTLFEMMVVVAVMAILAMISVPNLMRFVAKAKRSEAQVYLHALYMAEKIYYAEHGTYTTNLSGPSSAGWKPEGYTKGGAQERYYYTYGFPGVEGINHFTGNLSASAALLTRAYADKQGFLALAVADIDGDGSPDILSIDQTGKITVLEDDLGT